MVNGSNGIIIAEKEERDGLFDQKMLISVHILCWPISLYTHFIAFHSMQPFHPNLVQNILEYLPSKLISNEFY